MTELEYRWFVMTVIVVLVPVLSELFGSISSSLQRRGSDRRVKDIPPGARYPSRTPCSSSSCPRSPSRPSRFAFRDRYGWPVERIIGRPITNIIRLILHTDIVQSCRRPNNSMRVSE